MKPHKLRTYVGDGIRDWVRDIGDQAYRRYGALVKVPGDLHRVSHILRASIRVAMRHPDEVLEEMRAEAMGEETEA